MFEDITYEGVLDEMLSKVPDKFDKRESSFMYNALAPIAYEIYEMYVSLNNVLKITFFTTADRGGKIQRCYERGIDITQFDATKAIVKIQVNPNIVNVPIGNSFNYDSINYKITEKISDGLYYAECDTEGTVGNITGNVTPVEYVSGLESAVITEIHQYGEDEADEDEITEVYEASLNSQAYGGNRADYLEKLHAIDGVGGVKVFSADEFDGIGGHVKVVITTSSYTKPSPSFVDSLQTMIDPVVNAGEGYGIAPIGHVVTVAGANEQSVNISTHITLKDSYVLDDVIGLIETAIDNYFSELNENWENDNEIVVRISQVETRILTIEGVVDINETAIDGVQTNKTLDADVLAVRGTVNVTT